MLVLMPESVVKVILITNAGQGFGRTLALAYGDANYDVVCADKDVELASKTAAEIEELGGQAIPIQADPSTGREVRKAFEKVFEIFGCLSGIVHVVNFEHQSHFIDVSDGEFSELVDENFKSTFLVLKTAAKLLKDGWVVLVSPPLVADEPHMVALRGAITRLADGFNAKYQHIRVNAVVPSRNPSDPVHDAPLVENVRYLGSSTNGLKGHRLYVELPPPPKIVEALLPEVKAALDENIRQDDLEASLFAEDDVLDDETFDDEVYGDFDDDEFGGDFDDDSDNMTTYLEEFYDLSLVEDVSLYNTINKK